MRGRAGEGAGDCITAGVRIGAGAGAGAGLGAPAVPAAARAPVISSREDLDVNICKPRAGVGTWTPTLGVRVDAGPGALLLPVSLRRTIRLSNAAPAETAQVATVATSSSVTSSSPLSQ